jgi:PAS domain S-box-containing protein
MHGEGDILTRRLIITALLLLLCGAIPLRAQNAAPHKNVLALYWYGREYPTNVMYEQGLRAALGADGEQPPEYYSEYLEIDRFPGEENLLRDYLRQKYANHTIDVIVASAETPFEFLLADRTLFPGVPIVYTAFGPVEAAPERSVPGVAGVFIVGVYRKTLETMRAIHPDAKQVYVITGLPNGGGKAREEIIRRELAPFERDVSFTYLTDQPTNVLVDAVSHAPPGSLVMYVRHSEDSPHGSLTPIEAASLLARVSTVPVYSIARVYFGQGIVGGYLADHEVIGAQAGALALRIASGVSTADLRPATATLRPMFDWRALERWKIDPDRLPAGSDIQFRMPTAWDDYRGYIIGAVTVFVLQGLTITALVLQRARRRELEARHVAMLSAAPDMMFLLTKDGQYLDHHDGQLPLVSAPLTGKHLHEVLPAHVAAAYREAFARLSREPGPVLFEYEMATPGGERQFEARVMPCRENEVLVVVRDVTERKVSERMLHQTQADLSRLSRLTALGEFAASIAHEIRQPLTGILINTKTCLRWLGGSAPDLGEVRSALTDVVDSVQRADEIIRRNRELFKHHTVQKTQVDVHGLIEEVEALAHSRLLGDHITLITSVTGDVPPVLADRVELQQVLLNLIGNGIDAMESVDSRARRIEISASLMPEGNVKISVRDGGVGLDGVDRDRMFALSYTTKASGTGVGLAISRAIVEAHGGKLWAENNHDGSGATFSFTLPVHSTMGVA